MSTQLKGTECLTGKMSMVGYSGGDKGHCVQLTFNKPTELYGEIHVNSSNAIGYWFLNLSKENALDLAVALIEFANGKREEDG